MVVEKWARSCHGEVGEHSDSRDIRRIGVGDGGEVEVRSRKRVTSMPAMEG